MMKWLDSAWAFILYAIVMFIAYVMAHFWPNLPTLPFMSNFTIGLGAYLAKRYTKDKMMYANGDDPYANDKAGN
jgi:hypothetical protein